MKKDALLIFYKNPQQGKVKTRLAATVGNATAFSIFMQLLHHIISTTTYLPIDKIVFYSESIERQDVWEDELYTKHIQEGKDLGERMSNAFSTAFDMKYESVVIIGTDCPELTAGIIMNAFAYLNSRDVTIGPAADGGYYLLGMKQHHSVFFKDVNWSTDSVLERTIDICKENNLTYELLPVLHDIDEEKDLIYLEKQEV
jgi:rSAM/selenodomain-associated transferase 1